MHKPSSPFLFFVLGACAPAPPPPAQGQVVVQLPDGECTSRCVHDFGDIDVGESAAAAFDVANVGSAEATISVTSEGDASSAFTVEQIASPLTLAPDASSPFVVRAAPAPGEHAATLVIQGGDAQQEIRVDLRIRVIGDAPRLEPRQCDFGQIPIGESRVCDITIANASVREIEIVEARIAPEAFSSESVLVLPTFIQPGSAASVRIRGTASEIGRVEGAFSLYARSNDEPAVVTLAIEGI